MNSFQHQQGKIINILKQMFSCGSGASPAAKKKAEAAAHAPVAGGHHKPPLHLSTGAERAAGRWLGWERGGRGLGGIDFSNTALNIGVLFGEIDGPGR